MNKRLVLIAAALVVLVTLVLVARGRAADTPTTAPTTAALELLPDDVVSVRPQTLTRSVAVTGSVKAVRSAFVKAKVAGELQALTVREGDSVRAGQVLGQIDTSEYQLRLQQAEQQTRSARAQLDVAERTLANNKALVGQGFISPTALDTAQSNADGARANLAAAQAAADLARKSVNDARLVAPLDGQIAQRLSQPGERVAVDTRILEVVDLSQLELEAALAPQDVVAVRVGAPATLRVDGLDTPLAATVVRINPSASAGARTVAVYLRLAPHPALRQGLFAQGSIDVGSTQALALPASAVRHDQTTPYVLRLDGGKLVSQPVQPGAQGRASSGEAMVAITGLPEGTRVLAGRVGAVPAGTPVHEAAAASAAH